MLSGGCLTKGFPENINQSNPHSTPVIRCIIPKAETTLPHSKEIRSIPRLPINMVKKLISDEADPVSSCCCSNNRLALGGRRALILIVAGINVRANNQGLILPKLKRRHPLPVIMVKQAIIIDRRLNRLDNCK